MLWRVFNSQKTLYLIRIYSTSALKQAKMPFYAVAKGRTPGIYLAWPDCEAQVKGFAGARYKKFDEILAAQDFISNNGTVTTTNFRKTVKNTPNPNLNLKRTLSTSSQHKQKDVPKKKAKSKRETLDNSSDGWESSDDLNTILIKQMDDIEKRVKDLTKGVDNIIKKSTKTTSKKAILIEPVKNKDDFNIDHDGYVQVYTDGACSFNGKNGAKAGLGVYWGEGHSSNISAPVSGRATNNCGEIQAATQAIKTALEHGIKKLAINTDSQFLINSVTKWMPGWKRKGWKLKSGELVKNVIDFIELDDIQNKLHIKWNYVEAHKGIHGNEMADRLAKAGANMYKNIK